MSNYLAQDLGALFGGICSAIIICAIVKVWCRLCLKHEVPPAPPTVGMFCINCTGGLMVHVDQLLLFKSLYLQGYRVRPMLVMAWRRIND